MSARNATLREVLPRAARIAHRFWPLLRKERVLIAWSVLALLATTAFKLIEPWPLKLLFDRFLHGSERRAARWTFLPFVDRFEGDSLLLLCAGSIVVVTVLRASCDYLNSVGFATIGNRVLRQVRDEVYRHLQLLSLGFHNRARNGDLVVRVIGDVNMLRDVLVTAVLPLMASVLVIVAMWSVMFIMHRRLALVAATTVPLMWLHAVRAGGKIRESTRKQRQRESEMASTAAESLAGIKLVQALSLEAAFAADFSARNASAQKQEVRNARLTAALERTVDVLLALATGMVLAYGSRLVLERQLSPGDLLVFLAYLKRAFNPMQDFAKYTSRLAKATAAGERVLELLDRQPEVRDLPAANPAPSLRGHVRIEGVWFEYAEARPVLQDVTLDIPAGTSVAIVGESGSGKSTLASMLMRLYDPTRGRISVDGHDLRDFTVTSLRAQVSVVLQETLLFAGTIRQNIASAAPGATDTEVWEAANLANALPFIEALPERFDTIVGERGVTISSGQRQRLAVARAALRRSPILIFDEATTGLDEQNLRTVTRSLQRLARGRTALFITHDLHLAAAANLIVHLDEGRVIETGTHGQLLAAGGRYSKLYALQRREPRHPEKETPLTVDATDHASVTAASFEAVLSRPALIPQDVPL